MGQVFSLLQEKVNNLSHCQRLSPEIGIASQSDVTCNGYSIQMRVTTEDPSNNFLPDTGKINVYRSAAGHGIRLDGGTAYTGAEITPYYDSLLVKIISSPGSVSIIRMFSLNL